MKILDILPKDVWETPILVRRKNKIIGASPNEYDWLLKGDPEPFIEHLRENPEKFKHEWVQDLFFNALRCSGNYPAHRHVTKKSDDSRKTILRRILQLMLQGLNKKKACEQVALEFHKHFDTINKDYLMKARKEQLVYLDMLLVIESFSGERKFNMEDVQRVSEQLIYRGGH